MRNLLITSIALTFSVSCSNSQSDQPTKTKVLPAEVTLAEETKELPAVEIKLAERESPLVVGDQAPNFRLQDQSGVYRTLDELLTKNDKVALVFYRSADW